MGGRVTVASLEGLISLNPCGDLYFWLGEHTKLYYKGGEISHLPIIYQSYPQSHKLTVFWYGFFSVKNNDHGFNI